MPFKIYTPLQLEMIDKYNSGLSCKEVADCMGVKTTLVKGFLQRRELIRTQSDASILACKNGKKQKSLKLLIQASRTYNRFNPRKAPWSGTPQNHPKWIKDRCKVKQKRLMTEERMFFRKVMEERGYACELTGLRGKLSVHHIDGVWMSPERIFDRENCIVILNKIHIHFHFVYGNRTSKLDWEEYLSTNQYETLNFERKRNHVPFHDKTGLRYGRLVVVQRDKNARWVCECDCGNRTVVYSSGLNSGKTTSCGCYMREVNRARLLSEKIWVSSPASKKGTILNRKNTSYVAI